MVDGSAAAPGDLPLDLPPDSPLDSPLDDAASNAAAAEISVPRQTTPRRRARPAAAGARAARRWPHANSSATPKRPGPDERPGQPALTPAYGGHTETLVAASLRPSTAEADRVMLVSARAKAASTTSARSSTIPFASPSAPCANAWPAPHGTRRPQLHVVTRAQDQARAQPRRLPHQSLRPRALPHLLQELHRKSLGHGLQPDLGRVGRAAHQGPQPHHRRQALPAPARPRRPQSASSGPSAEGTNRHQPHRALSLPQSSAPASSGSTSPTSHPAAGGGQLLKGWTVDRICCEGAKRGSPASKPSTTSGEPPALRGRLSSSPPCP